MNGNNKSPKTFNIERIKLKELFQNKLTIPEYQRPYKWKQKNVLQLLNDVYDSMVLRKETCRIGTVILHRDNELLNIVDGQQRLVSLTLVIKYLEESGIGVQNLPLLESNFPHDESKDNIRFNYVKIEEWVATSLNNSHIKDKFKSYLLNNCEFVKMELTDVSEAFQLFDSQNARGKALEPYDLLKAFHLREMDEYSELERLNCVQKWEKAVNEGSLNNLGKYIYRIRKWARGEKGYQFTKDDIDEFKGINLSKFKNYPYLKPYLLNDTIVSEMSKNELSHHFGANVHFPFQITQLIINGKRFFEFIAFYTELSNQLFKGNSTAFNEFYKRHCLYEGYYRIGDTYVREMFESVVLFYTDKFAEITKDEVHLLLYKWCYNLRLKQSRVQYNSIDKYITDSKDSSQFIRINLCYHPYDFAKHYRTMELAEVVYPIAEVEWVLQNKN